MNRTVKTECGIVRGTAAADPRITVFKGVPFAAPPVGELRWCAPRPAKEWEGVRDCLEFAPISMQNIPGLNKENIYTREWNVDPEIPMDEDCLYLNIWTPSVTQGEKLPVFVWYFGGGLQFGNTAEMEFDGERLARRGIVVVTVNYRINVFGFLAHPELTKENPTSPANFGNLDQQFGLMWTKRNIASFGGDPDNITIGGQSAGGGSVITQLNHPGNKPFIQKAIINSGFMSDIYRKRFGSSLEEAERKGEEFFAYMGVNSLDEARSLPASFIRDKNETFNHYWFTVIDGVFQQDTYWNNISKGNLLDVPLMLGYTNNEFIEAPMVESMEELKEFAKEKYGDHANEYLSMIKSEEGLEAAKKNGTVNTFEVAVRAACKRLEEAGKSNPMYLYDFGPEIPGWDNPGAFHSSDLWFFFETLAKCWRPFTGKHYDLARHMCNYWANFMTSGNPNGKDADGSDMELWEPYQKEESVVMKFYEKAVSVKETPSALVEFLSEQIKKK
jgi:para-nitrobenzyl esterase